MVQISEREREKDHDSSTDSTDANVNTDGQRKSYQHEDSVRRWTREVDADDAGKKMIDRAEINPLAPVIKMG